MSFDESAIPGRSYGSSGKRGWVVCRNAVAQENVVLPVHVERFDVEILEVPPSIGANPGKAAVAFGFHRGSTAGEEVCRRLSKVTIDPNSLPTETCDLEPFIQVDEGVIGSRGISLSAAGQARVAIDAAQQGNGVAGIAVLVMTRYFEPHLVVADPAKAIGV